MDVQPCLGGRDGQDESADEQHHHGVCKAGHHLLVAEEFAHLLRVTDPFDSGIRGKQQEQDYDGNGGGPGGNQFQHPHEGGIYKDGDNPLLDRREAVNAEGFRREEPEGQDGDGHKDEADTFLFYRGRVQSILLTHLLHLGNQIETGEFLEHKTSAIAFKDYS